MIFSNGSTPIINPIFSGGEVEITSTYSQLSEVYNTVDDLITNLDDLAVKELVDGTQGDLDYLMDEILKETYVVLFGDPKHKTTLSTDSSFAYLKALNDNLEETLRCSNLNYFINSVLTGFDVNWHHLEWGQLIQQYNKLCVIAPRDHGKCLAEGTKVIMSDGTTRKIEDIKIGEYVMGADSKPRKVLNTGIGRGKLYRVKQSRGEDYVVNHRHTMCLYRKQVKIKSSSGDRTTLPSLIDIDIEDFIKKSNNFKSEHKGYKVSIELPERELKIEPYYLGLWLGDGTRGDTCVTSVDKEIIDYLEGYAKRLGLFFKSDDIHHFIRGREGKGLCKNPLLDNLREYKTIDKKIIPKDFLYNTKENRLKLLAGLIDSDGYQKDNIIYLSLKDYHLIKQTQRLCNSLGMNAKIRKEIVNNDLVQNYKVYTLTISGEELINVPCLLDRKRVKNSGLSNSLFNRPKILSTGENYDITNVSTLDIEEEGIGNYVSITIDGDKRFLLADNTVVHNSYFFSHAYPIWKLYRYKGSKNVGGRMVNDILNARGFIMSNEMDLTEELLETIKISIEENDILKDKLLPVNPNGQIKRDWWSKRSIRTQNGARINLKSYGGSFRGRHPGWIVVDDFMKDNVIYSELQRKKVIDYFHSVIMNAIIPKGQVAVVGTPFHAADLYADLKDKRGERGWRVFEYPAISPEGQVLWSDRYSYEDLIDKKESQGNIIFSRELLCRPIVSDSSLFPWSTLHKSIIGMDKYNLVSNIDSFPIRFKKVVTGCDFAYSASVGADFSVFTTWGLDYDNNIWLLHLWRGKGKTYKEQIQVIKTINRNFRPDYIVCEANVFQHILVDILEDEGLTNIVPHVTTGHNKSDMISGVPGMTIIFEQGRVKLPYGNDYSKNIVDLMLSEFASIGWTNNGIESLSQHDDVVMSTFMAKRGFTYLGNGKFHSTFL